MFVYKTRYMRQKREKKTRVDGLFIQNEFLTKFFIHFSVDKRPRIHHRSSMFAMPTHVNKFSLMYIFRYTWNGKNSQYPMIRSIRYPRYNTPNPIVTCFVVNLNVLKYINLIPIVLPENLDGDFYVGNMLWISNLELTLTFTSRDQTLSSTVLCKAPLFECVEVSWIRNSRFIVVISCQFISDVMSPSFFFMSFTWNSDVSV